MPTKLTFARPYHKLIAHLFTTIRPSGWTTRHDIGPDAELDVYLGDTRIGAARVENNSTVPLDAIDAETLAEDLRALGQPYPRSGHLARLQQFYPDLTWAHRVDYLILAWTKVTPEWLHIIHQWASRKNAACLRNHVELDLRDICCPACGGEQPLRRDDRAWDFSRFYCPNCTEEFVVTSRLLHDRCPRCHAILVLHERSRYYLCREHIRSTEHRCPECGFRRSVDEAVPSESMAHNTTTNTSEAPDGD